jgi:hypothetical protein
MKAKLIKQGNEYFLRSLIKDIPSSINVYHKISETEGEFGFGEHSGKLSKQNCDEIFGVVDVEKLAEEEIPYSSSTTINVQRMRFIHGFNKAMELNKDKLFTVEDMKKAIEHGANLGLAEDIGNSFQWSKKQNNYIQSLQQPTEIDVEIVMDKIPADLAPGGWDEFPKLDANGCLILKRIG